MLRQLLVVAAASLTIGIAVAEETYDVTRQVLADLDRSAKKQATAAQAFLIYQQFQRTNHIPRDLRKRFDHRRNQWKQRVVKKIVRLGSEWVSTEKRDEAAAEARKMVTEGFTLIESGDKDGARKKLLQASHHDKNAILPDFVLGMLNSGKWCSDSVSYPEHAIKHFRVVLQRAPNHAGALNNLGVACLKEGEVGMAIRHWEDAKAIDPDSSAVKHNVRRAIFENTRGTIEVTRGALAKLQSMLTVEDSSVPLEQFTTRLNGRLTRQTGLAWAISPAVVPEIEQANEKPEDKQRQSDTDRVVMGGSSGTGFVVADGYILTNRHVVQNDLYGTADVIQLSVPGIKEKLIAAKIAALSDKHDLALLRCPQLKAPALALRTANPPLASEVMVVSYPRVDVLGARVKTTRGIVTGLPEPSNDLLLYDATTNSGHSTGPVLSKDGAVVAVHSKGFNIGKPIAGGIPAAYALAFVATHIPDFAGAPQSTEMDWPGIAKSASRSTVYITVSHIDAAPQLARKANVGKPNEFFADRSCAHCKGWGKLACPHPKCRGGGILTHETHMALVARTIRGDPVMRRKTTMTKNRCPTCSGDNAVSCRFCDGGGTAR